MALELRVGQVDLFHPLLRILPDFRVQVGNLVGVVGQRELPVGGANLHQGGALGHPEYLPGHHQMRLPFELFGRRDTLLSLLPGGVSSGVATGARVRRRTVLSPRAFGLLRGVLCAERKGEANRGPTMRDPKVHLQPERIDDVHKRVQDNRDLDVLAPVARVGASIRPAVTLHPLDDARVGGGVILEEVPRGEGNLERFVGDGVWEALYPGVISSPR